MLKKRKKNIPAFRKKKNNLKIGMTVASIAILMLLVVVGYNGKSMIVKRHTYMMKEAELQQQIADEENRKEELKGLATYTKTKKYAEEVAKDKLGLVYENEILFTEQN